MYFFEEKKSNDTLLVVANDTSFTVYNLAIIMVAGKSRECFFM
jgi:hypothetical protein